MDLANKAESIEQVSLCLIFSIPIPSASAGVFLLNFQSVEDRHLGFLLGPRFQGGKRQKPGTSDFQDDAMP